MGLPCEPEWVSRLCRAELPCLLRKVTRLMGYWLCCGMDAGRAGGSQGSGAGEGSCLFVCGIDSHSHSARTGRLFLNWWVFFLLLRNVELNLNACDGKALLKPINLTQYWQIALVTWAWMNRFALALQMLWMTTLTLIPAVRVLGWEALSDSSCMWLSKICSWVYVFIDW